MRGSDAVSGALFSYVDLDKRVRPNHPWRLIQGIANDALASLSAEFDALDAPDDRDSIASERRLSSEHFSVDGTLIEPWTSPKSLRPKDGSGSPPDPGRNGECYVDAERPAALHLLAPHAERANRITLGGDKGYDTQDFVADPRKARHRGLPKIDWQFTFAMRPTILCGCQSCWRQ
jgi:hypothetical protein